MSLTIGTIRHHQYQLLAVTAIGRDHYAKEAEAHRHNEEEIDGEERNDVDKHLRPVGGGG